MYPTSIISMTFNDLIEQPLLFKSILENLVKICDIEIQKEHNIVLKPRLRKPRAKKTSFQDPIKESGENSED